MSKQDRRRATAAGLAGYAIMGVVIILVSVIFQ